MFIEQQHRPIIESDSAADQETPTLVHYFSDRAEPFKTVLPLLIEAVGQDEERVLVVTSPLGEVVDETIRLHRHPGYRDMVVVDENQRAFFEAVKASLLAAVAKIDRIEFARLDDEENED